MPSVTEGNNYPHFVLCFSVESVWKREAGKNRAFGRVHSGIGCSKRDNPLSSQFWWPPPHLPHCPCEVSTVLGTTLFSPVSCLSCCQSALGNGRCYQRISGIMDCRITWQGPSNQCTYPEYLHKDRYKDNSYFPLKLI